MWPFKKKKKLTPLTDQDLINYDDAIEKLRRLEEYKQTQEMLRNIDESMKDSDSDGMRTKLDKRRERLEEKLVQLGNLIKRDIRQELGRK